MIHRLSKGMLVVAVATALIGGPSLDAFAKKPKVVIKSTVDGKKLKAGKRTPPYLSVGGGTIGFYAQVVKVSRKLSKTLQVSCAVLLTGQTFPFTSTDCLTAYVETKIGKQIVQRYWMDITTGGTSVTFDSFDGVNIVGSFHAEVPPASANPDLPTLTIDGTFSGPAEQGDPNN